MKRKKEVGSRKEHSDCRSESPTVHNKEVLAQSADTSGDSNY